MKRAGLSASLGALVIVLGLGTIALCAKNRQEGRELDRLYRMCEEQRRTNARLSVDVRGHRAGVLEAPRQAAVVSE